MRIVTTFCYIWTLRRFNEKFLRACVENMGGRYTGSAPPLPLFTYVERGKLIFPVRFIKLLSLEANVFSSLPDDYSKRLFSPLVRK